MNDNSWKWLAAMPVAHVGEQVDVWLKACVDDLAARSAGLSCFGSFVALL
jgi:hypothetical protein